MQFMYVLSHAFDKGSMECILIEANEKNIYVREQESSLFLYRIMAIFQNYLFFHKNVQETFYFSYIFTIWNI